MTTAHALRAKRAREFQAALQDALRIERTVQSRLAPIAREWRTAYGRLSKAASRYNAMVEPLDPRLVVSIHQVVSPAELLETLRSAAGFALEPVLGALREAGPQLHKLPTGKQRRVQTSTRRRVVRAEQTAQERDRLEGAIRDFQERLTNDAMLDHFRQSRNATNRAEGKPEYTLEEYREVTRGYIRQAFDKLKRLP